MIKLLNLKKLLKKFTKNKKMYRKIIRINKIELKNS